MSKPDDPEDLVACGACAAWVSPGRFCVVCGAPLDTPGARRGFAASPDQPALLPHPTSTLLPQLPRADLDMFGLALGVGLGIVAVLAALGYFLVALLAGAALVPLLLLIYLVAVDVYEDEPLRVLLATLGWGILAGALYALLLRALFTPAAVPFARVDQLDQVLRGIVLPAVATAAMIAGPVILLPYKRFNDVLDGATFGALSGAGFVGAQIVVQSLDLLDAGLRPAGDPADWVLRVVIHGVAMPLVAAGAVGGACGALWLRFRAPGHEARALGALGNPVVAIAVAVLLMVAANLAILHLRDIPRLLVVIAIALVALVWLRLVIHVGLRQEAVEAVLADERPCQNCGRSTPPGSFCRECGVSLRALPKRAPRAADDDAGVPLEPRHDEPVRISGTRSLVLFMAALTATAVVVGAVVTLLAPAPLAPPCADPTVPCPVSSGSRGPIDPDRLVAFANTGPGGADGPGAPGPAQQPGPSDPMRFGMTYRDDRLGWELDHQAVSSVDATSDPGAVWVDGMRLEVVPASELTASQMLDRLVGRIGSALDASAEVRDHGRSALGPHIGYVPAQARYFEGDTGETGAITRWGAYALVASDGFHTAGAIIYVPDPGATVPQFQDRVRQVRALGEWYDDLLKRFYWPDTARSPGQQASARELGEPLMPDAFRRGWGIDRLYEQGLRGQGQTIAIYSTATFLDEDMAAWEARTGTTGPRIERLVVGGEPTLNVATGEVLLDLQTVRSIAPEATIINVEVAGTASYPEALVALGEDGRADILSISYGACEAYHEFWKPDGQTIPEADVREYLEWLAGWFQQAADAGLTTFASSGDEGVYGCVRVAPEEYHGIVSPIFPASIPSVVSVGGTLLWRWSDGTGMRESAWSQAFQGEGSGGGASRFFPMPAWQQELGLEGGMRLTPDVSGPGDPDSGIYWLYRCGEQVGDQCRDDLCEANLCVGGGGGTSQAAPFWAAVTALIRQAAEQEGLLDPDGDGVNQLPPMLPLLYEVAATRPDAFRDVVTGSNLLQPAARGWDPATGLGSPNVPVLLEAILDQLRQRAG